MAFIEGYTQPSYLRGRLVVKEHIQVHHLDQSLQPPIYYISINYNIFQYFHRFLAEACLLCSDYVHFGVQSSVFLCSILVLKSVQNTDKSVWLEALIDGVLVSGMALV